MSDVSVSTQSQENTSEKPLLTDDQVRAWIRESVPVSDYEGKKLLLIIPDATRTAPLPLLFGAIYEHLRPHVSQLDVMVALGTHPPMSEQQICRLIGIQPEERERLFYQTQLLNHEWDNPEALTTIGTISVAEAERISGGMLSEEVPIKINKRILDYDTLLVLGPVFPHEVVGFSGGNKYFFPGISGPELLNFFHWLGALITTVDIIGLKMTPVRGVIDYAATFIPREKRAITFVVAPNGNAQLHGLFYGTPELAWKQAADLSDGIHIKRVPKPFKTVLACAPLMYDELWVAGKCMYKLEPVVEEGGELIIYAPHLESISVVHEKTIKQVGYHCRDYFLKQWDRFKDFPRSTLAHSTHVRGQGVFEDGVERCRITVTLASKVPRDVVESVGLHYRDPDTIQIEDYADREDEGILLVRKAGEQLYRLEDDPR